MSRKAFHSLRQLASEQAGSYLLPLLGVVSALLLPLMLVPLGFAFELLVQSQAGSVPEKLHLGPWISIPSSWILANESPLRGLIVVMAIALAIAIVQSVLLWFFYRTVQFSSIDLVANTYRALANKNAELAIAQSVSGQRSVLHEALNTHLPRLRTGWLWWNRSWPRHFVQIVACLVLALLINPILTLLTAICAGIIGQLYAWADRRQRTKSPVLRERFAHHQQRLAELAETGPLLSAVHAQKHAEESIESEIRAFRKAASLHAAGTSWKTPLMLLAGSVIVTLLCIILSIQIVDRERGFSVAAALTLCLAEVGAMAGYFRLVRTWQQLPAAYAAAGEIQKYLNLPVPTLNSTEARAFPQAIRKSVTLDHLTLQDSLGRKLLEDLSLQIPTKSLVAVIASDNLQARAFAELLLGFGRPTSGRMLIDDQLVTDIAPDSFRSRSLWVSPEGPLFTGTIEDNLRGETQRLTLAELTDSIRQMNAYEALQNLADGLSTLVAPHDDRLAPDHLFRLGLARASLRKSALVVSEEPNVGVETNTELATAEALRTLAQQGSVVVVLPRRITTLRQADLVVLLHEHRIEDSGSHADLLQRSELYRHLNYVRFSPLRHLGND